MPERKKRKVEYKVKERHHNGLQKGHGAGGSGGVPVPGWKGGEIHESLQERRGEDGDDDLRDSCMAEGRNPVREVLSSGRTVERLYFQEGLKDNVILSLRERAVKRGIPFRTASRKVMDGISVKHGGVGDHQGVIAIVSDYSYMDLDDVMQRLDREGKEPFIILLDGIVDPHNLGAIIRTAECSGADAVVIPRDRAVPLTSTVGRVSAGAVNHIPVCKVVNLTRTLEKLKERGLWAVCADMDGTPMYDLNLTGKIALVIGNEGKGVSRLVSETCDMRASIPLAGKTESLNASVACGVLAYEIVRQRTFR